MRKSVIAGIAAAVLGLGTLGIGVGVTAQPAEAPAAVERATITQEIDEPKIVDVVEPIPEVTVAPIVEEAAPAEPAPAPAPNRCPSGTKAGAVDAAGNESNCQATSNGQPCVEYNDSNQCTAWYKP